jgi:hypothetical protein
MDNHLPESRIWLAIEFIVPIVTIVSHSGIGMVEKKLVACGSGFPVQPLGRSGFFYYGIGVEKKLKACD